MEREIFTAATEKVRVFGTELLDIRFKWINYHESVRPEIYDRMISERRQSPNVLCPRETATRPGPAVTECETSTKSNRRHTGRSRRSVAYKRSPEGVALQEFTRTIQAYHAIIAENITLVHLSTMIC